MGKTLYHSELVGLGLTQVTVESDVLKSKFQGKPPYVILNLAGESRNYSTENEGCAAFFQGTKGRTFTLVAEGREAAATLTYVGEAMKQAAASATAQAARTAQAHPAPQTQPPPRPPQNPPAAPPQQPAQAPQPPSEPQHSTPPPQAPPEAPTRGTAPPQPPAETDKHRVAKCKVRALKIAMVVLVAQRAASWVAEQREKDGRKMSEPAVDAVASTITIQLLRDGYHQSMPNSPEELLPE